MNSIDLVSRLQKWFSLNSDGEWEHSHGIRIETLDNPGWSVSVDLTSTPLDGMPFQGVNVENDDQEWYSCRVEDGIFKGWGGPHNLGNILEVFLQWAETRR